jgi:hypothetical protein
VITLAQARQRVGDGVVYRPDEGDPEQGVVSSVGERWVFVRYGSDSGAKATEPGMLDWLAPSPAGGSR